MKALVFLLLLITGDSIAQNNSIAHFSIWKPKPGLEQKFENGYKQHLKWHEANRDTWSWYGWYVISGPRNGLFIDATFDHKWSDFDNPINPAGDGADNALHTVPFGEFLSGYKMIYLPNLSIADNNTLRSKFIRLVRIAVTDIDQGKLLIQKLKTAYQSRAQKLYFLTFKMVDGGNLNQLQLLIGYNSFEELGSNENLQEELSAIESSLKIKTIKTLTSETLRYRDEMSLFFNRR